jgi:hypothetical protein
MTYLWIAVGIVAWLACDVWAYRMIKKDWLLDSNKWTVEDRKIAMLISAGGPISLFLAWLTVTNDRPAKW